LGDVGGSFNRVVVKVLITALVAALVVGLLVVGLGVGLVVVGGREVHVMLLAAHHCSSCWSCCLELYSLCRCSPFFVYEIECLLQK
jgi:hypothetical protein